MKKVTRIPKEVKAHEKYYLTRLDDETFRVPKKYKLVETLGKGSYGVVVSAKNMENGKMCAMKKNKSVYPVYLPRKKTDESVVVDGNFVHRSVTTQKRILREIKILTHIGTHPNVVSLVDTIVPKSFEKFSDVYFIMDLMDCDLKTIIESDQDLSDEHIRFFMYQILFALNYIHAASVLHRDLKPENLLINSDCDLKLCDFGLARYVEEDQDMSTNFVVSRWYRSPELLLCNTTINTGAIDIWSAGCIFAELLGEPKKRRVLFRGNNPVDQLQKILNILGRPSREDNQATCGESEEARRFVSNYSRGIRKKDLKALFPTSEALALDLLEKMLQFNPHKRVSAEDSLRHPYFKSYFVEKDANIKPKEFNYDFEKIDDSKSLKIECFDTIVRFYMRKNRIAMEKKKKKKRREPKLK